MTTQLDGSIGLSVPETTYGTPVTVTKFPEYTDAPFNWDPTFTQGQGSRVASRFPRRARRGLGKQMVAGDLTVEAATKGLGALLQAALGAVTTTQRGATGVWQQNHTPTTTDVLNSYTMQAGIPPIGGAASNPLTFPGMVCNAIEFDCPNGDIVSVKTSWNGREVLTATAYAAPSYPTPFELFEFAEGVITIGGAVTPPTTTALATGGTQVATIRDFNVKVDNALDDAGFNFGSAGKRSRKPVIGLSALTGNMTAEYSDNVLRDAWLAQTDLTLVLTFLATGTIGTPSTDHAALQIIIKDLLLEGELPHTSGGEPIAQSIDFTGFDDLSGTAPITVVYASTDTAP